ASPQGSSGPRKHRAIVPPFHRGKAMRKTLTKLCLSLGLALAGSAQAAVDLSTLDDGMAGPRTKVLVLGSVHLSELQEGFDPATLDPLLDRLAAYKPDIITIETIPGESCGLSASN